MSTSTPNTNLEGAMPTSSDTPVAATVTSTATQGAKPSDLETALARIAELEHANSNAIQERDRHRKKLTAYEKTEEDAKLVALSDAEKMTKAITDSAKQIKAYQEKVASYEVRLQAQSLGIIDPELAALAISSTLEYDDNGMPTNVEKLLKALVVAKPYLVAQSATTPATTPATSNAVPQAPAIPAMNPGRNNIQSPANTAPGPFKPIRLSDVFQGKK